MSDIKNKLAKAASVSSAAILLTCSITACHSTESVDALVAEAKQYHEKGDDTSAQIQLKNALQKSPDNAEARYLLGVIDNETGDPQSAEKELRKAMSVGMSAEKVMPDLAKSLLMERKFQEVLDETAKISAQSDILALRGDAYLGLGKSAEAKISFESSLKSNPNFATALIGLARSALIDKNVDAATSYADQAVSKNPQNIDALSFKASLLRQQGAIEPALSMFDQILALKPGNVEARLNKANIEIKSKKYDAAKADIDAARKVSPKNLYVLYMQSLLDFSQGKNVEALDGVQKVLHVAPEYMPAVLIAGAIQYGLGATQQAEQYLTKYLDKNPDNLYARKLLISTLLKIRQPAKANSLLAPVLKEFPQDVDLLALAGQASMQAKDFTQATDYFEKASALAPQTAKLHEEIGLGKIELGKNADAVAELEMATTLDSKSPQAGILLVMTHMRLKEFDKALAAENTLEKEQPNNPVVQNLKGGIYLGKNDVVNARASFQKALSIQATYFPATANLAELDLREKNPDAAKKRFEALLAIDKKNIQAMNALAILAQSQKHQEEATTWLERASTENPESLPAAIRLATHYLQIGEKQKALTLARKLQVSNPADADMLNLLAQAQFANDDKTSALDSYKRLASLLPNSAAVQLKIASVQMTLQNTSAASDAVQKALLLQPDYLDAEVAQVSLDMRNGNQAQAIDIAKKIQKQSGQSAVGYEMEGDILLSQKKPDLAAKAYEQAFTANQQKAKLLMKLRASLIQAGKSKEADIRMNQWFKDHPADVEAHVYLAESYLAQKQFSSAVEQYKFILQQEPNNVGALNNLAWVYQQENDPHALETAEKAYQLAANNAPVLDTLGWLLVEQGNTARGLPLLQKASASAPAAQDIRYHLALGLLKSGDKSKARVELEQLLASGKPFAQSEEVKALLKKM
jgi:putative PEP-CTERM system TPR-repeat lipoprotein